MHRHQRSLIVHCQKMTAWTESKYTSSKRCSCSFCHNVVLNRLPETQPRAERRAPPTESGVLAQTASLSKISSTATSWHPEYQLQLNREIMPTAASSASELDHFEYDLRATRCFSSCCLCTRRPYPTSVFYPSLSSQIWQPEIGTDSFSLFFVSFFLFFLCPGSHLFFFLLKLCFGSGAQPELTEFPWHSTVMHFM